MRHITMPRRETRPSNANGGPARLATPANPLRLVAHRAACSCRSRPPAPRRLAACCSAPPSRKSGPSALPATTTSRDSLAESARSTRFNSYQPEWSPFYAQSPAAPRGPPAICFGTATIERLFALVLPAWRPAAQLVQLFAKLLDFLLQLLDRPGVDLVELLQDRIQLAFDAASGGFDAVGVQPAACGAARRRSHCGRAASATSAASAAQDRPVARAKWPGAALGPERRSCRKRRSPGRSATPNSLSGSTTHRARQLQRQPVAEELLDVLPHVLGQLVQLVVRSRPTFFRPSRRESSPAHLPSW